MGSSMICLFFLFFFCSVVGIIIGPIGTNGGGIGLAGINIFLLGLWENVLPWCLRNLGFGKVWGIGGPIMYMGCGIGWWFFGFIIVPAMLDAFPFIIGYSSSFEFPISFLFFFLLGLSFCGGGGTGTGADICRGRWGLVKVEVEYTSYMLSRLSCDPAHTLWFSSPL